MRDLGICKLCYCNGCEIHCHCQSCNTQKIWFGDKLYINGKLKCNLLTEMSCCSDNGMLLGDCELCILNENSCVIQNECDYDVLEGVEND